MKKNWMLAALLPMALFASCTESGGPDSQLTITPDAAELLIGDVQQFTAIGARGTVQWSSSNSLIASVISQTGFVSARARGQAVITAASIDASASVNVNVLAPAQLNPSPLIVNFPFAVGSSQSAVRTVTVTNAGDRPLSGIIVGPIAYSQGQPTGWLLAAPNGSTPPVVITLTASPAGRARGVYHATVPVSAPNVANSPQSIAVSMAVQAPAGIAVSRDTVPIAAIPGETKTEVVAVTNSGDVPLTGLSTTITYTGQPQNWLQASFGANTTAPATLSLIANTPGLTPNTYLATVRVASTVSGVAPRDVAVRLVVNPGPSIQLSPSPVTVNAVVGTNAAARIINVTNGGGGSLTGLGLGTVTYGAGASNWITPQLGGTTANTTLTLNFATATLQSGNYTATVPVTSPVASNSPANLTVSLVVGPLPVIAVNPAALNFADWAGSAAPPAQAVLITNSASAASIPGLSFQITYGGGASNWLTGQFQGGVNSTPATLLLNPNTTALPAGTYSATVTIATTMTGVAQRPVNITYTIQSFTVNLYPTFNGTCTGCHTTRAPFTNGNAQSVYNQLVPYLSPSHPSYLPCKLFSTMSCAHIVKFDTNTVFMNAVNSWIAQSFPFN